MKYKVVDLPLEEILTQQKRNSKKAFYTFIGPMTVITIAAVMSTGKNPAPILAFICALMAFLYYSLFPVSRKMARKFSEADFEFGPDRIRYFGPDGEIKIPFHKIRTFRVNPVTPLFLPTESSRNEKMVQISIVLGKFLKNTNSVILKCLPLSELDSFTALLPPGIPIEYISKWGTTKSREAFGKSLS